MFIQKHFEGAVEKVMGHLDKLKFLLNKLSYRGHVLNNLVASFLWHWLAGVDPPAHLLPKIHSIMVNYF